MRGCISAVLRDMKIAAPQCSMGHLHPHFSKCYQSTPNKNALFKIFRPSKLCSTQLASRSDSSTSTAAATNTAAGSPPYSILLPRQAVALFASGAVLGPFCDGLHSQHNVLHYANPSIQLQLQLGESCSAGQLLLATWWNLAHSKAATM